MNLQELIQEIDRLKAELAALQPMKKEWEDKLMQKFRLEWNYNSNHIEGNTLTYGETELLLIFEKTTGDHDKREYDEMQAHDVAIKMTYDLSKDKERPLTETFIKQLNEIILVKPFWKEALTPDGQNTRRLIEIGSYKRQPNSVRLANGNIFNYASPEETSALMGELMSYYKQHESDSEMHPLLLAAGMHYKFVRIHPFDDGNGRVARLLMNYILIKNALPPVIIKSEDKKNYLTALNKADTGNLESFFIYIGEQLLWSLNLAIKAAKEEDITEMGDFEKKLKLLKKEIEPKLFTRIKSLSETERMVSNILVPFITHLDRVLIDIYSMFMRKGWWIVSLDEGFFQNNIEFVHYPNCKEISQHLLDLKKEDGFYYFSYITFAKLKLDNSELSFSVAFDIRTEDFKFNIEVLFAKPIDTSYDIRKKILETKNYRQFLEVDESISLPKMTYDDIGKDNNTMLIKKWTEIVSSRIIDYINKNK